MNSLVVHSPTRASEAGAPTPQGAPATFRVVMDGASDPARVLIDGEVFCTLAAGPPEELTNPITPRAAREMARLICVINALEAHVAKEQGLVLVR